LLGALILFGFWPRLLSDKIRPSAERIVKLATGKPDKPAGRTFRTAQSW
jgi:hypothetical protein